MSKWEELPELHHEAHPKFKPPIENLTFQMKIIGFYFSTKRSHLKIRHLINNVIGTIYELLIICINYIIIQVLKLSEGQFLLELDLKCNIE